jgi:hypothetical protein
MTRRARCPGLFAILIGQTIDAAVPLKQTERMGGWAVFRPNALHAVVNAVRSVGAAIVLGQALDAQAYLRVTQPVTAFEIRRARCSACRHHRVAEPASPTVSVLQAFDAQLHGRAAQDFGTIVGAIIGRLARGAAWADVCRDRAPCTRYAVTSLRCSAAVSSAGCARFSDPAAHVARRAAVALGAPQLEREIWAAASRAKPRDGEEQGGCVDRPHHVNLPFGQCSSRASFRASSRANPSG